MKLSARAKGSFLAKRLIFINIVGFHPIIRNWGNLAPPPAKWKEGGKREKRL